MKPLVLVALMAPASAGAFTLDLPVDCVVPGQCFIQNYQDRDPGPDAADYTCAPLSYDGHSGTDFALPTTAAMQKGVAVLAAAPGVVAGVRDGMEDLAQNSPDAPDVRGRECGNGLVIDHEGGWQTQYCHMAKGSLRVRPGQSVAAGTPLGLIGLSGQTEFPHLHLAVRRNGVEIDPFDPDGESACGPGPVAPLWSAPLAYAPGGLIGAGFAADVPSWPAVRAGLPQAWLTRTAPALVLWVHYFGNRQGDDLHLTITGPDGVVIEETLVLDRTQAQAFRAIGKRLRAPQWATGRYEGTAVLKRAGATIGTLTVSMKID